MKKLRMTAIVALAALMASGMSLAAKKIEFTGEFTSPAGGFPPGPPPQTCAERFGSYGAEENPAIIEGCNSVVGQGIEIGVFEGDVFV